MRAQRRFIGVWRPVSPGRRSQGRGGSASLAATASADAGELPCALLLIQHISMRYMEGRHHRSWWRLCQPDGHAEHDDPETIQGSLRLTLSILQA